MSFRAALLVLAALAAPGLASAQERDLGAMLGVARACLAQVSAQRGSEAFASSDMAGLVRQLASDIDYAETWSRHDGAVAARYLAAAMDCDRTVAAWAERNSRTGTPLRRTETARGDTSWVPEQTAAAPDLSFLITGRQRRSAAFRPDMGQELAAWDSPYSR
jgi:hypothetical protein